MGSRKLVGNGALQVILKAEPGKETEALRKAGEKPEKEDTAADKPKKPPVKPPQPGLAWEAQSQLDRDKSS